MIDTSHQVTIGGLATGVAAAALTAVATRSVAPSLYAAGAGALLGGVATDQLQNVAERHGISGFALAMKPSVSLGVATGALAAGAISYAAMGGSGIGRIASISAGALLGAAAALSALNGLGLE